MPKEKVEDWQLRKNSLRLKNFDYAARHSNFVTIITEHRQTFFTDERIANATIEVLLNLRLKLPIQSLLVLPDARPFSRAYRSRRIGNDARQNLRRFQKSLDQRVLEIFRRQIMAKAVFRPRYPQRAGFSGNN